MYDERIVKISIHFLLVIPIRLPTGCSFKLFIYASDSFPVVPIRHEKIRILIYFAWKKNWPETRVVILSRNSIWVLTKINKNEIYVYSCIVQFVFPFILLCLIYLCLVISLLDWIVLCMHWLNLCSHTTSVCCIWIKFYSWCCLQITSFTFLIKLWAWVFEILIWIVREMQCWTWYKCYTLWYENSIMYCQSSCQSGYCL